MVSGNGICCFHPLAFHAMAKRNCVVKHSSLPCNNIQMFGGRTLPLDHKGIPTRSLVLLNLLPQTQSSMFYICRADEFLMAAGQGEIISFSKCSHSQLFWKARGESAEVSKWRLSKYSSLEQSMTSLKTNKLDSNAPNLTQRSHAHETWHLITWRAPRIH